MGFTRFSTKRELEIRSENRYTLHPRGQKRCTKCECVFDDIHSHFDKHHKKKDGSVVYTGQCKNCLHDIRGDRTTRYKSDIELYVRRLMPAIRCRAKEQHLQFNLSRDFLVDLWNKQSGLCYYTGSQMNLQATTESKKSPHVDFPSLDKLDPSHGYVEGNVVWCLYGVNRMKNEFSKERFVEFCKLISDRFKNG